MWITGTENRLGRIRLATISIVVPDLKLRQKDPDLTALVRQSASRIETRLGWRRGEG
jgi:DNA-binding IclR family transcriptional regulator